MLAQFVVETNTEIRTTGNEFVINGGRGKNTLYTIGRRGKERVKIETLVAKNIVTYLNCF